jgi:hypothetical protein
MNRWQVEEIAVESLIPYAGNARTHPDAHVAQVAASIEEFGFNCPVLIDQNNMIVAGHGRILAAKKLNMEAVPCVRLSHLSDAQKRAFIIADNKLTLNSGWDEDKLRAEIELLMNEDFDISLTGFDDDEILSMFDKEQEGKEYSSKIESPIYEVTGEQPDISQLVDEDKTNLLIKKILESSVSEDEKEFLLTAATRHLKFSYQDIAEYYAHSAPEMQELMEDSALVIVDFNKAIEQGFVSLSEELTEVYLADNG